MKASLLWVGSAVLFGAFLLGESGKVRSVGQSKLNFEFLGHSPIVTKDGSEAEQYCYQLCNDDSDSKDLSSVSMSLVAPVCSAVTEKSEAAKKLRKGMSPLEWSSEAKNGWHLSVDWNDLISAPAWQWKGDLESDGCARVCFSVPRSTAVGLANAVIQVDGKVLSDERMYVSAPDVDGCQMREIANIPGEEHSWFDEANGRQQSYRLVDTLAPIRAQWVSDCSGERQWFALDESQLDDWLLALLEVGNAVMREPSHKGTFPEECGLISGKITAVSRDSKSKRVTVHYDRKKATIDDYLTELDFEGKVNVPIHDLTTYKDSQSISYDVFTLDARYPDTGDDYASVSYSASAGITISIKTIYSWFTWEELNVDFVFDFPIDVTYKLTGGGAYGVSLSDSKSKTFDFDIGWLEWEVDFSFDTDISASFDYSYDFEFNAKFEPQSDFDYDYERGKGWSVSQPDLTIEPYMDYIMDNLVCGAYANGEIDIVINPAFDIWSGGFKLNVEQDFGMYFYAGFDAGECACSAAATQYGVDMGITYASEVSRSVFWGLSSKTSSKSETTIWSEARCNDISSDYYECCSDSCSTYFECAIAAISDAPPMLLWAALAFVVVAVVIAVQKLMHWYTNRKEYVTISEAAPLMA